MHGSDLFAYFTEEKLVRGSAMHSPTHDGATWHFASAENRDLFELNPEKYACQYGGYCA
jgi:YHS domain-containing protein